MSFFASTPALSRRNLLKGSLAVAALAAAGGQTLSARANTGAPPVRDFWSGQYSITETHAGHLGRDSLGGVDFAMGVGTSLLACMDGVVQLLWDNGTGGYSLVIRHDNGWSSWYLHCSSFVAANGQRVKIGDLVAKSGGAAGAPGAGASDGPHLHWHLNTPSGERVDPLKYASAGAASGPSQRDVRVHHITASPNGWNVHDTGITLPGHVQFGATAVDNAAYGLFIANNKLQMITPNFQVLNSGLGISNGSTLGVVKHSSNRQPQALVVEGGRLHHVFAGGAGWVKQPTPITVPGNTVLEAVDMGPGWAQAMANEEGRLHQIWANAEGWKNWDTGIRLQPGSRLSVMPNQGWPQLMTLQSGRMHHIFGTSAGWKNLPSNLVLDGPADLSMIATRTNPTGIGVSKGRLLHVGPGGGGWTSMAIGKNLAEGTRVYATPSNSSFPQAYALSPVA